MRFDIGAFWKNRKQPEKVRRKNSQSLKLAYKTGKHKKVWLGKHFSKQHKLKLRKSNIETWKNVKLRNKIDRILTGWWEEHPNIRIKRSDKLKEYYWKHPEAFKKFMQGGKNASKLDKKSKLGLVRSWGEKEIADYLFENRIKARYESIVLKLDSWLCVPDFYLPELNYLIEFYGGHPGSYKKKVIKNKLYKKYKIPVILIQPYELRDLSFLARLKPQTSSLWKKFAVN